MDGTFHNAANAGYEPDLISHGDDAGGRSYDVDHIATLHARADGIPVRIESADQFKPALEKALKSGKPYLLDVIMENAPVPTTGHWNIMDIYSPGQKKTHVTV